MNSDMCTAAHRWLSPAGREQRTRDASLLRDLAAIARADAYAVLQPEGEYGVRIPYDDLKDEQRGEVDHLLALEHQLAVDASVVGRGVEDVRLDGTDYEPMFAIEADRDRIEAEVAAALLAGAVLLAPRHSVGPWPGAFYAVVQDPRGEVVEAVGSADVAGLREVPCPRCKVDRKRECVDHERLAALIGGDGLDALIRELHLRGRDAIASALVPSHPERIERARVAWQENARIPLTRWLRVGDDDRVAACVIRRTVAGYEIDGVPAVSLEEALDRLWPAELRRRAAVRAAQAFVGERGAGIDGARAALARMPDAAPSTRAA